MSNEILLITLLATYRITLLISKERGPFDMLGRFRTWAGIKFDEYSNPIATGELSEGILCPYCLSVWIGIGITTLIGIAAILGNVNVALWLLFPFAISGAAVFFFKWAGV